MAQITESESQLAQLEIDPSNFGFLAQLRMMLGAFWGTKIKTRILTLTIALLAIILATTYGQYRLNSWNAPFYDSLQRRDLDAFLIQLEVFVVIAGVLLVLNVIQAFLNQMMALSMREGLTRDLIDQWMKAGRAIKLANFGAIGVNPDQRLHEDARNLAEITTSLSIGLVSSSILLVSFIGVLWEISADFAFNLYGHHIAIPGYMVWAALIYAGTASLLSSFVGRNLPVINAERYSKEAELRFSLMHANENLASITLARGEGSERGQIQNAVTVVLAVIWRQALAITNLTWVSSGFGWLTLVAPILIASPVYFNGMLSFGWLMVAVGAFTQVNAALRWYIDNFRQIADWKAALYRVSTFRKALLEMDKPDIAESDLTQSYGAEQKMVLRDLSVLPGPPGTPTDRGLKIPEAEITIGPGERVMVNGDASVNRHLLFQAMAGLWQWGKGNIIMPPQDDILFMPQRRYFPDTPLRAAVAYPRDPSGFDDVMITDALKRAGLERLAGDLDRHERWDRVLEEDDQARLRLANVLLTAPKWLVLDDALEGLEPETQEEILKVMDEMKDSAIIYIGRQELFQEVMKSRAIHLQPV
ncbi:ABC transporter ATP-binding protein/permease [Rhizobiales bacterium RZME27]|uniref:ABC transporter ATP-binding protein/permease n=1 Tax=Endobacterium cereale TaxID=2663029 RepID=A0A6A8AH54_9HYPH|nr:ABC transporter ATP-binding protein/permease [Endobacterium cereale]MQY49120.1 ABC transporter ATP-binding protein/permease [Endobacterium cereale]